MSGNVQGSDGGSDELGRDMELASALAFVDPATGDPNYWLRFQSWVMARAGHELARRRMMADLTIGEVLSGWARAVVPTAVVAAIVAGFVLLRTTPVSVPPRVTVEDLLLVGLEDQTIPATLTNDEDAAAEAVAFAGERF
jgi:hypothetical protein